MSGIPLRWRPISVPREPVAVFAEAAAARGLAAALRRLEAAGGGTGQLRARVAVNDTELLVLADKDRLPWADGAVYLGTEGGLLLPTTLEPSVPPDLLRQTFRDETRGFPLVVLPGRVIWFSASSGILDLEWLEHYASRVPR